MTFTTKYAYLRLILIDFKCIIIKLKNNLLLELYKTKFESHLISCFSTQN